VNTSQGIRSGPEVPEGYTALYNDQGLPYLVPNFMMPAAQFMAVAEYNKQEIEYPQVPHGVS
jgi:hypothetical protein